VELTNKAYRSVSSNFITVPSGMIMMTNVRISLLFDEDEFESVLLLLLLF